MPEVEIVSLYRQSDFIDLAVGNLEKPSAMVRHGRRHLVPLPPQPEDHADYFDSYPLIIGHDGISFRFPRFERQFDDTWRPCRCHWYGRG